MASFMTIELDTTGPEISVIMPNYTTQDAATDIWIVSSETLSVDQDFYVVDSKGKKHEVTFEHQEDKFYGSLKFRDFSYGIATLFVQVRDEVRNPSFFISKSINVLESAELKLTLSKMTQSLITERTHRFVSSSEKKKLISIREQNRQIEGGIE